MSLEDLFDCSNLIVERCQFRQKTQHLTEFMSVLRTIEHRFSDVSTRQYNNSASRSWKLLYTSLIRLDGIADKLCAEGCIAQDECEFIQECTMEVQKFINRYFAKRENPDWRLGA